MKAQFQREFKKSEATNWYTEGNRTDNDFTLWIEVNGNTHTIGDDGGSCWSIWYEEDYMTKSQFWKKAVDILYTIKAK